MSKKKSEFMRKCLAIPVESKRNCQSCYYFSRSRFHSGRWPCHNPAVYPGRVGSDYPCYRAKSDPPPEEGECAH